MTWRLIFSRQQHIFGVGADAFFVAHAKPGAFSPEDSFRITTENESAARLGKGNVNMRRKPAVDGCQLLPHKRGRVYLRLSWRILLSGGQLETESDRGLAIAVGFDFAKEAILGPERNVS